MSIMVNAATAMASGRPTPTPMPAAAPVVIPELASCAVGQVGSVGAPVLVLVAVDDVAVAALSMRSVDKAAFITALKAPTVKFSVEQSSF